MSSAKTLLRTPRQKAQSEIPQPSGSYRTMSSSDNKASIDNNEIKKMYFSKNTKEGRTEVHQHSNNIYYNVTRSNKQLPSNANLVSTFTETRTAPFLQNPKEYVLSVIRFSVDGSAIPLFYWNNVNSGPPVSGTPSSQPSYKVTLTYSGVDYSAYVPYLSSSSAVADIATGAVAAVNTIDNLPVYSVKLWVAMVNSALSTAYTALQLANGALTAADPPVIYFNPNSTTQFTLYADKAIYDETVATPVYIYFNFSLFQKFNSFSHVAQNPSVGVFGTGGKDFRLRVTSTLAINEEKIGAITYDKMEAEGPLISSIFDIQNLIITTNSIPSREEYNQNLNDMQPILTDFNVAGSLNHTTDRINISYVPTAQYRLADLMSNEPLRILDLNLLWQDRFGFLRPVQIVPGAQISVKMVFVNQLELVTK